MGADQAEGGEENGGEIGPEGKGGDRGGYGEQQGGADKGDGGAGRGGTFHGEDAYCDAGNPRWFRSESVCLEVRKGCVTAR